MNMDLPVWRTLDPAAAVLVAAALVAVFYFRLGVFTVLVGSALAGVAYFLSAGALT